MSISGTINFTSNAEEIIQSALENIGYLGESQAVSGPDFDRARVRLNRLLKHWVKIHSINLFLVEECELILKDSKTSSYILSSESYGASASTELIKTRLTATSPSNTSNLTVESTAGMTANDYIGVRLENNTTQMAKIVSINSPTGLTINGQLKGNALVNARVFSYTVKLPAPKNITHVRYVYANNQSINVPLVSRHEFFSLTNRGVPGIPTKAYADIQSNTTTLHLYPVPGDDDGTIQFSAIREVEDINSVSDNFDLPKEWELAIEWSLSYIIGPAFGRTKEAMALKAWADQYLDEILSSDVQHSSIYIRPAIRYG